MAYLMPSEFVKKMVDSGESKIFMSTRDTLIRAYMVGGLAFVGLTLYSTHVRTGPKRVGV